MRKEGVSKVHRTLPSGCIGKSIRDRLNLAKYLTGQLKVQCEVDEIIKEGLIDVADESVRKFLTTERILEHLFEDGKYELQAHLHRHGLKGFADVNRKMLHLAKAWEGSVTIRVITSPKKGCVEIHFTAVL